jgi:hypothetical protein
MMRFRSLPPLRVGDAAGDVTLNRLAALAWRGDPAALLARWTSLVGDPSLAVEGQQRPKKPAPSLL